MSLRCPKCYDAFISYAWLDNDRAFDLLDALESRGLSVYLDRYSATDCLVRLGLEVAIENSAKVVALVSPAFFRSQWTEYEEGLVLDRDPRNRRQKFVPILIQTCEVPARLVDFLRIDARGGFSPEVVDQLVIRLAYDPA